MRTNTFAICLPTTHGPMTNTGLGAKRAEDSMSMAAMDLYTPLIPDGGPAAMRMLLPRRMSWMTIMEVTRTFSESESEMYTESNWNLLTADSPEKFVRIPVAISPASALRVTGVPGELNYVPTEPRYTRAGKATTQRFAE